MVTPRLGKGQVDNVVSSLEQHYYGETPPPKFVIVDPATVLYEDNGTSYVRAKVVIETEFIPKQVRTHTVLLRFKVNPAGRVITSTISHL